MEFIESNHGTSQQNMNPREVELIQELTKVRLDSKSVLEFEDLDGYELPPRTQFSMLKKPSMFR